MENSPQNIRGYTYIFTVYAMALPVCVCRCARELLRFYQWLFHERFKSLRLRKKAVFVFFFPSTVYTDTS